MRRLLIALLLLTSASGAYLISSAFVGGRFVFEAVPAERRPVDILVDTESVAGVGDPVAITQELMDEWNAIPEAEAVFGTASPGGLYNGSTVGDTFGRFTNRQFEVAFDETGEIMSFFGVSPSVLGITLKSVDTSGGRLLDFLVVINTRSDRLREPGTGATAEELFRSTLLHELGHTTGIGHTAVGIANLTTFGFSPASPAEIPTMFAFRIPVRPQEGLSLEGDDRAALVRNYPGDTSGLGSISGQVRALSGMAVNTIQVRAVGPEGAAVEHIGTFTNEDGRREGSFRIRNLLPGGYRVILETANGRASVDSLVLAGDSGGLGTNPFIFAADEHWQPGDTYDPALDDPADFAVVQVRASRDTGSVDFVLNAAPIFDADVLDGSFENGDAQIPDFGGGFHFADYYVFQGSAGQGVTIEATSTEVVPQVRLLRPTDMAGEGQDLPLFGNRATITEQLDESGVYSIVVSARATTGNPGGRGDYTLSLVGAGSGLAPAPAPTRARATRGPADPGDQWSASPVCSLPLLQLHLAAPSHEELWVDRITVRASGTGDEVSDVSSVRLVLDGDGDGEVDARERELAAGIFAADDGSLIFDRLDLEIDAGATGDLLVVYDVEVVSVSTARAAVVWFLPVAGLLLLLRRRGVTVLLVLLALLPVSCGSGSGGECNRPFDADGLVVTFAAHVDRAEIVAFSSAGDPGTPIDLGAGTLASGTLSVSD